MNDIERLIAAVVRPEPSESLDDRIHSLLAEKPARPQVSRWKIAVAWCGTAACVGLLGFCLGRQSVNAQATPAPASAAARSSELPPEGFPESATVITIPLRKDQLAGLFVRPAVREGMLGRGPVRIVVSTSSDKRSSP